MDKIFKPCHVLHGESHARAGTDNAVQFAYKRIAPKSIEPCFRKRLLGPFVAI